MLQTAFRPSCLNRASVFEWHKRFKEGRESMRDDKRCGRSKEVRTPELIGQIKNFMDKDRRVSIETISAQFDVSVGTVQQVHCSRRRLRRRGLEFHVCTINKSAHTKKVWKLFGQPLYVSLFFQSS